MKEVCSSTVLMRGANAETATVNDAKILNISTHFKYYLWHKMLIFWYVVERQTKNGIRSWKIKKWTVRHSIMSESLRPCGQQPARLLCPWDSLGKSAAVGCHALLQGISMIQGSNSGIVRVWHWQAGSLPPAPPGSPLDVWTIPISTRPLTDI